MNSNGIFKKFYGGEQTAANQCEGAWNVGGKGMTVSDASTAGTVSDPRYITYITKMVSQERLSCFKNYLKELIAQF